MFKLKTYLRKPQSRIEAEFGHDLERYQRVYKNEREKFYIPIDDDNAASIIDCEKFDVNYFSMIIVIQYNGANVVELDNPPISGTCLWFDYLAMIERYLANQYAEGLYGIDYFEMQMKACRKDEMAFSIYLAHNKERFVYAVLPQKAFIKALLHELQHIWGRLHELGAFEREALRNKKHAFLGEETSIRIQECLRKLDQ
ncbi:hypothetical protein [Paenibacillus sp. LHD-38]|uniref:hypothetical protein n=1 Tax=Paenibacillus sp. LHD-38 TaxID=3072143 RepID=UPI00280FD695|nr:hypothetical protein [Paenibacillus sp. LHD-38]MDQ8738027.1 hypothetical protein [Paenibacillus sp. LHD-38]